MKKRGISPLIATVLLVGLTVSVVTVIFIFGKEKFEDTSSGLSEEVAATSLCNDIDFRVHNYSCPADKLIDLTILNMVDIEINGFRVINDTGLNVESSQLLSSFGSIKIDVSIHNIGSGELKVVPLVREGEVLKGCGNKIQTIKISCPVT